MKSLIRGILVVQGMVVIAMGVYLFNLQSQIDELHLVLPLDQEQDFGSQAARSSEIEKEAVIQNINARIDNLADTIELIANAKHSDGEHVNGEALTEPGSGNPDADAGGTDNRVASIPSGGAESSALGGKKDSLEQSGEQLSRVTDPNGLNNKGHKDPRTSKIPARASLNDKAHSSTITKIKNKERSGSVIARGKQPVQKKPLASKMPGAGSPTSKKTPSNGDWSVNLMSLTDPALAKKQLESLLKKGISAEIKRTNISGKNWYRVQVSGFKTKRQAQEYGESVAKKLGLSGAWVTR
ncbi:MAG: SPOR domain-containing protein [Methylococcales bacterium]